MAVDNNIIGPIASYLNHNCNQYGIWLINMQLIIIAGYIYHKHCSWHDIILMLSQLFATTMNHNQCDELYYKKFIASRYMYYNRGPLTYPRGYSHGS